MNDAKKPESPLAPFEEVVRRMLNTPPSPHPKPKKKTAKRAKR